DAAGAAGAAGAPPPSGQGLRRRTLRCSVQARRGCGTGLLSAAEYDQGGTMTAHSGPEGPITYASAGVDVEAGDRAVELMKAHIEATHTPQVVGGFGGFAGMYDASELKRLPHPLLATSTDGVGTKVAIAQALDKHDTIGYDLVGMVVDDIVVVGA